jgi:hypothetical protein
MEIIILSKGFIIYIPMNGESEYSLSPHSDMILFVSTNKTHKEDWITVPVPDNQFLYSANWEKLSTRYPVVNLQEYPELEKLYDIVQDAHSAEIYSQEFKNMYGK